MLNLQLRRLLKEKGISDHRSFLRSIGFPDYTIQVLLNNEQFRLTTAHVEKLCLGLYCTPNDLYKWEPEEAQTQDPNHPLRQLIRHDHESIISKLKKMSLQEIEALSRQMDAMNVNK